MIHSAALLHQMKKNQWLPQKAMDKLQLSRLKAVVNHSYETVPYYRQLFKKNNLLPTDIKRLEDIEKIPITTKQDLIKNFPKNVLSTAIPAKEFSYELTSGSTGLSLTVARSRAVREYELALVMHPFFEYGLSVFDKVLTFDDPRNFGKEKKSSLGKFNIFRKEKLSIFENSKVLLNHIQKSRPDVIYAPPTSLFLIAKLMKKEGIKLSKTPKFMLSTSETLHFKVREAIEEQFKTPLFDQYGSTEFPRIAWQCPKCSHLHINSDSHLVEFMKTGKPVQGKMGLITVTSLYNFGMPLLRYSLNDVSESINKKCSCGRTLPLMKSIEGRKDDFIIDSKGETISPKVLCYEFDEIKGIKEYKIIQKKKGSATIYAVKAENFDDGELNSAIKRVEKRSNGNLKMKLVYKKAILAERKKLRRVISYAAPEF